MRAEIICVGTELLLGDILNTNVMYLSKQLASLGISVFNHQTVGDNPARLKEAAILAKNRSDIVIYSGGLGPTKDDLTKQTVAEVYNDELVFNEEVAEGIRSYFKNINHPITDNNMRQAFVPKRGRYLENKMGTAPGIVFIDGEKLAILMPGPPTELENMMQNEVMPIISRLSTGMIISQYYSVMGIGESALEKKIEYLLEQENPTVALYAKKGEVQIRVSAKAKTKQLADEMLKKVNIDLCEILKDYIYSEKNENIQTAVVNALIENEKTLATAESCTGGLISNMLVSVNGASKAFTMGLCPYSDEAKINLLDINEEDINTHSSVSSIIAQQMATNVLKLSNADFSIATTGYAGASDSVEIPAGTVFICVADNENTYLKKLFYQNKSREDIMLLASKAALDLLRRVMFNLKLDSVMVTPHEEVIMQTITKTRKEISNEAPQKKKGGIIKGILYIILLIILGITLGIGWVFVSNGYKLPMLDFDTVAKEVFSVIENFTQANDGDVAAIMSQRQNTDFFTLGFEDDTLDMLNDLSLQNPSVKGWLSFKMNKKEFLILDTNSSEDNEVYIDTTSPLEDYVFLFGFTNDNFFDFTNIDSARQNSKFVYFTNEEYKDYQIFSYGTYDKDELDTLLQLSSKEDFIIQAKARSLFNVDVPILNEDKLLVLVSETGEGEFTVLFCKEFSDGIYPSIDYKTESVLSDWYINLSGITQDTSLEAMDLAKESYDKDNFIWDITQDLENEEDEDSKEDNSEDDEVSPSPSPSPSPSASISPSPQSSVSPSSSSSPSPSPHKTAQATASPTVQPSATQAPTNPPQTQAPEQTPVPEEGDMLTVTMNGVVTTDTTVNILSQIVALEMSSSWHPEALKAQAVATHTYILYRQAYGDAAPVVSGRTSPTQSVVNIVSEVSDIILTTNGSTPIYTPYTASAAGRTNASSEVWGGYLSHLVSVESKYDYLSPSYQTSYTLTLQQVEEMASNIGATLPEDKSTWFNIIDYTSGGYVKTMSLGDISFSGTSFRDKHVKNIGISIRSAAFTISYENDVFIVTTSAYGHGVGLSQWGAQLYAQNEGWTYDRILSHYYTGVQFTNIG